MLLRIKYVFYVLQAAQLCMEQSESIDNPFMENKSRMVKQYLLWNGDNINRLQLPAINFSPHNYLTSKQYSGEPLPLLQPPQRQGYYFT